ncbi:MAG: 1-(5-phosphoribosyl)-5-[(5-phosphoribosylamino)methylideneamino]imidazole-4-carboxamide isomerase [Alphaproteobacteria bacterium]|nr:1-(5-phosphoribosyl)-5-[(5-phosphoribosylamino)methylideneamino]imidazole-4-carboxamide isomerase [Alphaproteobacteria bacterium]
MILYPAIDIKNGACVRLLYGDLDAVTEYNPDPGDQARQFVAAGCDWIHVVDLDGAVEGQAVNHDAVQAILRAGVKVQLGGGIRDMARVERWIEAGVTRVILGTAALKNPQLVKDSARAFPGRIAVGADARGGMIAAEGWVETTDVAVLDLVKRFEDSGVAAVIFTDIGRDGALTGVNLDATAELARATSVPVIASGGVASMDDITALAADDSGIDGVITGRALYDGRLDLTEALMALKAE